MEHGFLAKECKRESDHEQAEANYETRFERIRSQIIEKAMEDGIPKDWSPRFNTVHSLVMDEIEAEKKY